MIKELNTGQEPHSKNFIEDPTFDPSVPKRCPFPLWDSEERQEQD